MQSHFWDSTLGFIGYMNTVNPRTVPPSVNWQHPTLVYYYTSILPNSHPDRRSHAELRIVSLQCGIAREIYRRNSLRLSKQTGNKGTTRLVVCYVALYLLCSVFLLHCSLRMP